MGACCSNKLVKTVKEDKYFPQFVSALPNTNKVIVITGTTTGTGFIASRVCLEKGATVVTLNRKSERSDKADAELMAISSGKLVPLVCDLNDLSSVKNAADKIKELFPDGIHVLANNAGIMAFRDIKTTHGYDIQMHTNHLAHFLLTAELLPLLEKGSASGDARIVNHSSEARKGKKLDAKYLKQNAGLLGGDSFTARFERYHQTKLANILFTYALHDRLKAKESKIKALVCHPGLSTTNLQVTSADEQGASPCILSLLMKFAQSSADGTIPLLKMILDENVSSGDFYGPTEGMGWMRGLPVKHTPELECNDVASKELLWKCSEEAIGANFNI